MLTLCLTNILAGKFISIEAENPITFNLAASFYASLLTYRQIFWCKLCSIATITLNALHRQSHVIYAHSLCAATALIYLLLTMFSHYKTRNPLNYYIISYIYIFLYICTYIHIHTMAYFHISRMVRNLSLRRRAIFSYASYIPSAIGSYNLDEFPRPPLLTLSRLAICIFILEFFSFTAFCAWFITHSDIYDYVGNE